MTRPVAVVTVTYNAERHIADMLVSVRRAADGRDVPIVVVDNGSTDATVQRLREDGGVLLIEQGNTGFAHGVNRGVAAAPAEHDILVLNPDVIVEPDAIDRMTRTLEAFPEAGVIVPRLTDEDGHVVRSLRRAPSIHRTLVETLLGGNRAGRFGEAYAPDPAAGPRTVDWATGAVMLLRRTVFDRVGGLDESFFLYSEETDYCLRVRASGHPVVVEPRASVMHVGGELGHHPRLWTLRTLNRVRRYRRNAGWVAGLGFWLAQSAFEARRALSGDAGSRAALRALMTSDLDQAAIREALALGGDPAPMIARHPRAVG